MSDVDLVVRGDLVLSTHVVAGGRLAINGGKIVAVLDRDAPITARQELNADGRLVFPGLVDTHVHSLSAPTEGIATATAAAAAGGVTTIMDMPFDASGPINSIERLRKKSEDVSRTAYVDVALCGTIAKVNGLKALPDLVAGGVAALKFSLFETDPDRFPRILDGDLLAAFLSLAQSDIPIFLHAELGEIIEPLRERYRAEEDPLTHGRTRPVVSETAAIAKALELALWSGARIHIAHVTHPRGFELIQEYRDKGARVSGETCVHYLALSEDDVIRLGALAKVNPPIRDREARDGLWRELVAGRIATVSTDHAPWPLEAKQRPILAASSGVPGLETFLPVMYTEAGIRGLSPVDLARLTSFEPARLVGLGHRKGRLAVGYDADFVVVDPEQRWDFDASQSHSSAKWSPFHGRSLRGRVLASYVRGRAVFENGRLVAQPGSGEWLLPSFPD